MAPPKIAIVGGGAAAVGALLGIRACYPNADVVLFSPEKDPPSPAASDGTNHARAGREQDDRNAVYADAYHRALASTRFRFPPSKTYFGASIPFYSADGRRAFAKSDVHGGLTNYWGASMTPYQDADLDRWPIRYRDLAPYYRQISQFVGIAGERGSFANIFDPALLSRPSPRILRGVKRLNEVLSQATVPGFHCESGGAWLAIETRQDAPRSCIECGECMIGCMQDSIFSARRAIAEMSAEVTTIRRSVHRVDLTTRSLHTANQRHGPYDLVLLAAGCPQTTEIVMRSTGMTTGPTIVDNAIFQFPIFNFGESDREKERYLALTNSLLVFKADDQPDIQIQIYPNFDYLWRAPLMPWAWQLLRHPVRAWRDRLLWARLYTHSDFGHHYNVWMDERRGLHFTRSRHPRRDPIRAVLATLKGALRPHGFWIPPIPPLAAGTSTHLAGTLPYGNSMLAVDRSGAIAKGVHLCDSSPFPDSPAASPTFTIMANAMRTAQEALSS